MIPAIHRPTARKHAPIQSNLQIGNELNVLQTLSSVWEASILCNDCFDIFDDACDPLAQLCSEKDYQLAYLCVNPNLSMAGNNELFRNCAIATVSNFTWFHTVFKWMNEMSNVMGIKSWKSGKVLQSLGRSKHPV
jgi:hypothetical protein